MILLFSLINRLRERTQIKYVIHIKEEITCIKRKNEKKLAFTFSLVPCLLPLSKEVEREMKVRDLGVSDLVGTLGNLYFSLSFIFIYFSVFFIIHLKKRVLVFKFSLLNFLTSNFILYFFSLFLIFFIIQYVFFSIQTFFYRDTTSSISSSPFKLSFFQQNFFFTFSQSEGAETQIIQTPNTKIEVIFRLEGALAPARELYFHLKLSWIKI